MDNCVGDVFGHLALSASRDCGWLMAIYALLCRSHEPPTPAFVRPRHFNFIPSGRYVRRVRGEPYRLFDAVFLPCHGLCFERIVRLFIDVYYVRIIFVARPSVGVDFYRVRQYLNEPREGALIVRSV